MKFTPLTDEELRKQRRQMEPGLARFEILIAEEMISKAGNPTLKLTLRVIDKISTEGQLFDYISDSFQWKIKHLYQAIGEPEKYLSGEIKPSDLIGKGGLATLYLSKSKDPQYEDRIQIKDYHPLDMTGDTKIINQKVTAKGELPNFDSDVPF